MKIVGDDAWLELEPSEVGPPDSPADTDFVLNVTVNTSGYSAADQAWILGEEWQDFLLQVEKLERNRQGSAVVMGASPDDLRVELFSTDHVGHMGVRGYVRRRTPKGFLLGLEFGFAFEPDQLPHVLKALKALTP